MVWKKCGSRASWPNLSYSSGIYVEEGRKTTKILSQNSWCADRDSNQAPPEYKALAITLLKNYSFN
jgi:hypothetical protein